MNIIVLTSAMVDSDFNEYIKFAKIKPNPSNQNFYHKLIKALSFYNNVSVVSLRPFSRGMFEEDYLDSRDSSDGSVKYYYPYEKAASSFKVRKQPEEILATVDRLVAEQGYKYFTIVVDTLRYSLLKAVKLITEKYHMPVVGVVTDNPTNLTGVKASYITSVRRMSASLDGYIALTESLNRIFNVKKRPFYLTEGLVEDIEATPKMPIGEYLFFGGALYERYGVKRMLDAFHKSNCEYKFVVAGTGALANYVNDLSEKDKRILYLGLLDKTTIYSLEQHAVMNINPRPYEWKMDRESVPSKLLEYFASGAPTMSTKHSRLMELFQDNVTWIEDDSERGLEREIERIKDSNHDNLRRNALYAKLKTYELYGLRTQGEAISHFLQSIKVSPIE